MSQTIEPVDSTTLQSYEHQQLLHRARRYIYIKSAVSAVIVFLFLLTLPPALGPRMVAIVLADTLLLVPYWLLVQRYATLATCLSLGITSLVISAGDWVGGYQTGASGILYALLILGGHLVLIKPLDTYLISGLITAIYVSTIALEVKGVIPIHFPFTLSNLFRVVSLSVICMFGLTILTDVVTRLYRELLERNKELLALNAALSELAIEKAQLYDRGQKRTAQLAVVNEVGRRVASTLDIDQLLQEVVVAIQQGFNYYNVTLSLLDEATHELEVRAIAGGFADLASPGYRQAIGMGIIGWTAQTGQSLLANDVTQDPRYISGFLEETFTGSELCVPLKLAGQVIGALDVLDTQLNAFDPTDLMAMETLADQIAMAIENARLFGETKHRFEETMALYQTSLDITAQLKMTDLLNSVVERAVTLLQAETGGLFLYNPEREELRGAIGYGLIKKYIGVTLKPGEGMAGRVFRSGEPMIVNDYRTWEGKAALYEADQPFTSVLQVPLKWQERVIGVLVIANLREKTFNQDDVWLATLFANQAVVAIENARLHQEAQHRVEALTFLNQVGRAVTSSLNLKQILTTVMAETAGVLKTEACSILLLDEWNSGLVFGAAGGPRAEELKGRRLLPGQGIADWAARQGQPLLVPDVREDPRFYPGIDEATGFATRSVLAVPLEVRGKVIGVIEAVNKTEGDFSQTDVALLSSMAQWAAIAIENARLYQQTDEQLQAKVKELSALYAIAEVINRSDLDTVLRLALDSAIGLTGMESGGILLLDPPANEIFLRAHRGWSPAFIHAVSRTKADEGLVPRLLESAQVVDDLSRLTKERRIAIEREGFQSLVSTPLKAKERTLGVMGLSSRTPHAFVSEELELLVAIGNQIGVAVDRANLQAQELRAAILEERQYMAQQMHDDIAQTLGYLGLQVDAVMGSSSLAQDVKVQTELEEIRKAIEGAYKHVRSSIVRLEEDVPGHLDLVIALPEIISKFERQTRCRVESRIEAGQLPRLSPSAAFQTTYIIREALTNVGKHSGADLVHLTLQSLEDGCIEVTVQDNGRGFDLDREQQSGGEGFGLRFMRERAERIGGSLKVESQPGQGTRVVVSLPPG